MAERLLCKQEVAGSNPAGSISAAAFSGGASAIESSGCQAKKISTRARCGARGVAAVFRHMAWMNRVRGRLTYANAVSTLALFLVVAGGTAVAADHLAKNSVGTARRSRRER